MNRRKFIMLIGGGSVLAAGAGIGGFAATRTPHKALLPWHQAGSLYKEPRRKALSYAILAPNPHNRQPWKIDLSQPQTIKIFVDTDRLLPHTDPFNRQITIGFGCFLETLRIAAAQDGYGVNEKIFPFGSNEKKLDERPVAIITFYKDAQIKRDKLFAQILHRRSLKTPYDLNKSVLNATLEKLKAEQTDTIKISTTNDQSKVAVLRKLTAKAMLLEIETPRTYQESVDLFRIGKAEVEANPDGISFYGPLFDSLALLGAFSRKEALDKTSLSYKQGIDSELENANTAMAYVWLITKTNTRVDQIETGRQWVRVNLAATGLGLGVHPLSQALQEYPEMAPYYKKIHEMIAPDGANVQMLGRLGYGQKVPPKPRWSLKDKIIKA